MFSYGLKYIKFMDTNGRGKIHSYLLSSCFCFLIPKCSVAAYLLVLLSISTTWTLGLVLKGPVLLGWVGQLKGAMGPETLVNDLFWLLNSVRIRSLLMPSGDARFWLRLVVFINVC